MPAEARTGLAPQGLSQLLHNLFLAVAEREGCEQILACVLGLSGILCAGP
jgi:hypothetical protein